MKVLKNVRRVKRRDGGLKSAFIQSLLLNAGMVTVGGLCIGGELR